MVRLFTNPIDNLLTLQKALADTMTSDWFGSGLSSRGGVPPINIFQQDGEYAIIAELPGVDRKDIDIDVQRNRIRISGQKQVDYGEGASVHRRERQTGAFDRTFATPFALDADKVKAEYNDGILALSLPRAEQDKPRSINIS
ncbi:MAG: Hsp20/alpha crystallin family protein [Gammaproteobacteria bacterium]|nr:Hsp20/alpha crystallin family protein [Gammaproteobacteria bacterium]